MRSITHSLGRAGIALGALALFLLASSAFAQDLGQTTGQTSTGQDTSKSSDNSPNSPASPVGLAWADSYVRQIGTSGLLAGTREGIGWGSLFIPSASATGLFERFEATSTLPASTFSAGVFQTAVVYDHRLGSSRLAIQYSPSMAVANGQVIGSFSNQNTSLDLLLYTRPRWNVRFSNTFSYYYTQQAFGTAFFDVNPSTGGTVTNNFLSGPVRWLNDSAYFSIAYALSRRTSVAVSPSFVYSESGVSANGVRAVSYGGSANLNYRTSERQTVGVQYSSQLIHERFPGTTGGAAVSSDTLYETIAATLERQVSATWFVHGSAGVSTYSTTINSQSQRQWQAYGALGVVKQLGRSSMGLNYSRGDTLSSGLVSNIYADRVDATFHNQTTRRFGWMVGGGYLRQVGSNAFAGWYGMSDVQFLLAPRAGLFSFFDFSHNNQGTNTANLYTGNRDFFTFGVRWQPGKMPH